jgi:hypothetical protein
MNTTKKFGRTTVIIFTPARDTAATPGSCFKWDRCFKMVKVTLFGYCAGVIACRPR